MDEQLRESEIASLARDGYPTREIGAQLFISPRTIEYQLHKVFTKLGIRRAASWATLLELTTNTQLNQSSTCSRSRSTSS
jgi:DNA-binding CsgD family transcriptional regulator